MRVSRVRGRNLEIRKTTALSIVINSLQILMMALILLEVLVLEKESSVAVRLVATAAFLVVGAGAAVDIWDALVQRRLVERIDDMDNTIEDLESLNNKIRAQRHDFLNHLQVVYSLMEMEEYREASEYIEKVYGAITALSRTLRTANPSINALLQVKIGACERAGIQVSLNIQSSWDHLPMPGWEMCKVLGNIIDNAMDALEEVTDRQLSITLTEDLHTYRFIIANNGPMIPVRSQKEIFKPGVTGKGEGHGMGLYIVRKTLEEHGGMLSLSSTPHETAFSGWVPREIQHMEDRADEE